MPIWSALRRLLDHVGRNGPVILLCGATAGVLLPQLAEWARPLMGPGVFCFTLGGFLRTDATAFRVEMTHRWRLATILLWATFGVPAVAVAVAWVGGPLDAVGAGLLLATIGPPGGSSAAVAAMLGLNAPLALMASLIPMLAAPLTLPLLAQWGGGAGGGPPLAIDPLKMMLTLGLIVGGAAAVAAVLRRKAGGFVRNQPHVMTGIAVAGLLLTALGAMDGLQTRLLAEPGLAALVLAAAFGIYLAFQLLGMLLFAGFGPDVGLTAGLLAGNRAASLTWAAAGMGLPPETNLALAMSVLPCLMAPAVFRWLIPRPADLFAEANPAGLRR